MKAKIAQGPVVRGAIVTRARFPEGAQVTIVMEDTRPAIDLTPEEEAEVHRGMQDVAAGRVVSGAKLLAKLRPPPTRRRRRTR